MTTMGGSWVAVSSLWRTLVSSALLVTLLASAGCSSDEPPPDPLGIGCKFSSECTGDLICSFGSCHAECATTKDCPSGQSCVISDEGNVCQLEKEVKCAKNTDCDNPLTCALDLKCRNECEGDRDCLGDQVCAVGNVCAEPGDVNAAGMLKDAPGSSDCKAGEDCKLTGQNCHLGVTVCMNGVPTCTASADAEDGTSCGKNAVCSAGDCVACMAGSECTPDAKKPCALGTLSCAMGPSCEPSADAEDGTGCGSEQVCSAGVCTACEEGATCQPDPQNPCEVGTVSCSQGPSCEANGDAVDGASCGADQVCSSGECVDCVEGSLCKPAGAANQCKTGLLSCKDGPVCEPSSTLAPGAECGAGMVCDSGAHCVACVPDAKCTPSDDCHQGKMTCTNGPACVDQQTFVADGSVCQGSDVYNFCTAGSCGPCTNGNACLPTNPCHKGTWYCYTAPPTCNDTAQNQDDGTPCGDDSSCVTGACVKNDRVLTVKSGGAQSAMIDAQLATVVTVQLLDGTGAAVPSTQVKVTASAGAYAAPATTDGQGNAKIFARVGRALGTYTFTATAPGAGAVDFTATAIAPTAKSLFTLVNTAHTSGYAKAPGPGTASELYYSPYGVAVHSNGTVYVSDYCAVFALAPSGHFTLVAGQSNACGSADGIGSAARFSQIRGLALDESRGALYVADWGNSTVRLIDLGTGAVSIFAGGGSNSSPPYGDGGPADSAYLRPTTVHVSPSHKVLIGDYNTARIRQVDPDSSLISTFALPTTCTTQTTFAGCGGSCGVAWDADGRAFVSGSICVPGVGTISGVARVEDDGSFSHVAGNTSSGSSSDAVLATNAYIPSAPAIAFDKAGNLVLSIASEHKIRRIDSATGKITTLAGDGTAGISADYVAASSSKLSSPEQIAFDADGNLYFGDHGNYSLRVLWGIGSSTPSTATLAKGTGDTQSVSLNKNFTALSVTLKDGANAAISGAGIQWRRLGLGSGFIGGSSTTAPIVKTNASGVAAVTGRVGLSAGDYQFQASYVDIHGKPVSGSPVTFTITAAAPTAGTIFTLVNSNRSTTLSGIPGPGTFAQTSYIYGAVEASDGSLYIGQYCSVLKLSPQGELSVLAGDPSACGSGGDSGLALDAQLYGAVGLALDETAGLLYIADYYNQRIRMVSLTTGVIDTFAGGNSAAPSPGYGDGGTATSAYLYYPTAVSVGPGGVYVVDHSHGRIRVVDGSGIINPWLSATPICTGAIQLYGLTTESQIVWAANGVAYISGTVCGTQTGGSAVPGVLRRDANGTLTKIAGQYQGGSGENVDATSALLGAITGLALSPGGNLAVSIYSEYRVRLIDLTTGKINTIAGNGVSDTTNSALDYVAATSSSFYYPYRVAYTASGHLLVGDYYGSNLRTVW
jgi:sugar lactone lactonase YvrE